MAFYDDPKFILSHIHHSFITSDDTGMCEAVMLNEVITDKPLIPSDVDPQEMKVLDFYDNVLQSELMEGTQSYDIVSDMELIGAHRLRSNTAQRLERLKREWQLQSKIKNIQWKEHESVFQEADILSLFPKKTITKSGAEPKVEKKSALSEALELFPAAPNNPFSEYTRFDGRISRIAQTKKVMIYLTMLPSGQRDYPMEVICLANARVHDLIGLICWQYTHEEREPKLKPNVSNYCLRIAEETGEVDEDFPSLDPKELVAKFRFPVLAFVEKDSSVNSQVSCITIYIGEDVTKLELPSLDVTLKEVVEQIRKHRKGLKKTTHSHVEKLNDPGIPLSVDSKISDLNSTHFRLVIEDSSGREIIIDDWNLQQMALIEAPLYKSFTVMLTQKMGINTEVQLGISDEKVEISPLPQKGAAKLLSRHQKPTTYYTDAIAACEIISKKYSPGKTVFKIVHRSGEEFKSLVFESDNQTAQKIVKKLQLILDMRFNNARKDYQLYRERKLQKKHHKSHSLPFS